MLPKKIRRRRHCIKRTFLFSFTCQDCKWCVKHGSRRTDWLTECLYYDIWQTADEITMRVNNKKSSPYSITKRMVPELIPVLGSQPAGDVSHKPGSRLPLHSARPTVTLKRAATSFAAGWKEARWVWTVCLRLLPDSVTTAIWTRAILCLSPAR